MSSRSSSRRTGAEPTDRVSVGRVITAHGIRGELKVRSLSDNPVRFSPGARMFAVSPSTVSRDLEVRQARPHKGDLLVRFAGVDDRDAAGALVGAELYVREVDVPEPPEGSFYHFQLEGCRVIDRGAGELGEVRRVLEDGGGSLLEVEGPRGVVPIPFVEAFVTRVDLDARTIEIDLPDGLIETCAST